MQPVLHGVRGQHWLHELNWEFWKKLWTGKKAKILEHCQRRRLVHKKHPHIMSFQKMKEALPYLVTDPAVWQETVKVDKSLRLLKENASQASLQRWKSSELAREIAKWEKWLASFSTLTPGWWLMTYGGGCKNRRPIGNARINPSGLDCTCTGAGHQCTGRKHDWKGVSGRCSHAQKPLHSRTGR